MYDVETYWDAVASRIASRKNGQFIAGDDEPYYRYKRGLFLTKLKSISFSNKKVLEVGSGPGGNLMVLQSLNAKKVVGCDISQEMIELALQSVPDDIEVRKVNGKTLPFDNNTFELVLTSTVLQHILDNEMLDQLIESMCRVASREIYIFERIEKSVRGNDVNVGRPISLYKSLFERYGFSYVKHSFIRSPVSHLFCGAVRKILSPQARAEGEHHRAITIKLQQAILPFTKFLDRAIPLGQGFCFSHFRNQSHKPLQESFQPPK